MFDTLLIANRGEIACRVAATARRLGVRTVAVYSDADADARHVRACDEAYRLGPAPARESYLRGDAILAIARRCGAQAIHPGYGFLSENADFAKACAEAGIAFVGPTPEAILAMGLKDRAKEIARSCGAPVLPGYWGEDQSDARLTAEADRVGYPLLVKAIAGGGGRGIRRVDGPGELSSAIAAARREAAGAFGDDRLMLEKLVLNPRHIEVQVFGDSHGNLVHLFERDCSVQRRRQKLIEEAPAPMVDDGARAALTEAALKIARAVDYRSAGTVEFVAEGGKPLGPDDFWFLEMNTRLQVEHPVTEMITGLDLVEWQLRVAAGEPLPLGQVDIRASGWAIEARVVAEDPNAGFLPSSGPVTRVAFSPKPGARLDRGYSEGDVVPDGYDSLLAKVIVKGRDRDSARRDLIELLEGAEVLGPATNIGFLARTLRLPAFADGTATTGLLETEAATLTRPAADHPLRAGLAAASLALAREAAGPASASPWDAIDGFRINGAPHLQADFALGRVAVELGADDIRTRFAGGTGLFRRADAAMTQDAGVVRIDWMAPEGPWPRAHVGPDGVTLIERGEVWRYRLHHPESAADEMDGGDEVKASLPGRIAAVLVEPGQSVARGAEVAILEAMKMEHTLVAPRDGVVEAVPGRAGAQVKAGELIMRLGPLDA
jgi:acetyl/propionyl-CoA carboxylase alpha subunit